MITYSIIHEELLILYFEKRGHSPERFERMQRIVLSVLWDLISNKLAFHLTINTSIGPYIKHMNDDK